MKRTILATLVACLCTSPAPASALPYHEWSGTVADPKGVVVLVHPGGWASRPSSLTWVADDRRRLVEAGFAVVVPTYASGNGPAAIKDISAFYNLARSRYPAEKVCLMGNSAGGHLAMMVAAMRWDVPCVVSQAGPTDLTGAAHPGVRDAVTNAFGTDPDTLRFHSPLTHAWVFGGRLMLAHARNDFVVGFSQAEQMAAAAGVPLNEMGWSGEAPIVYWMHGWTFAAQVEEHYRRTMAFIAQRLS